MYICSVWFIKYINIEEGKTHLVWHVVVDESGLRVRIERGLWLERGDELLPRTRGAREMDEMSFVKQHYSN